MIILVLLVGVLGLFKDQIGEYDWSLSHIGRIEDMLMSEQGSFFLVSSRGLIEEIRQNGRTNWRKMVDKLDTELSASLTKQGLVTYTPGVLSMWRNYQLIWSTHVILDHFQVVQVKNSHFIVGTHGKNLIIKSERTGKTVFSSELGTIHGILGVRDSYLEIAGSESETVSGERETLVIWKIDIKNDKILTDKGSLQGKITCLQDACLVQNKNNTEIYSGSFSKLGSLEGILEHISGNFFVTNDFNLWQLTDSNVKKIAKLGEGKYAKAADTIVWVSKNRDSLVLTELDTNTVSFKTAEVPYAAADSEILKMWAFPSSNGIKIFVSFSDYSFVHVINQALRWKREEALGHANLAKFIDLPPRNLHIKSDYIHEAMNDNSWEKVPHLMLMRFNSHLEELTKSVKDADTEEYLESDKFKFNKLLLIATEPGLVFALHSVTGKMVWVNNLQAYGTVVAIEAFGHHDILIVTKNKEATFLIYLDSVAGTIQTSEPLINFKVESVIASSDHGLILFSEDMQVKVIRENTLPLYLYRQNGSTIEGFTLSNNKLQNMWSLNIPTNEQIIQFSSNNQGKIHQPAIATGHSRIIYKFSDSNLFGLTTLKEEELFIYIINGVTGKILSKMRQEHASLPINQVFYENKFIVHFYSNSFFRYEITVVELYSQETSDFAVDMIQHYIEGMPDTYSSYAPDTPVVLTQTYSFLTGVKAMGVTETKQGITKPNLLMILNNGQVFALDMNLLSACRKQEEKIEIPDDYDQIALPIYKPILPLADTNILTYHLPLEGLQAFSVAPTELESTSMVAVYGLDLFVVRVMPEKSFDMLTENFNKATILMTITALATISYVIQVWFEKKEISKKFNL